MSYTYGQIQTRIADELHRSDLTSQIQKAIISAVEHYERERFWFNESISTSLSTTASQNYVAAPSDLVEVDKLQITVGSSKYNLFRIGYEEWATEASTTTTTGQPTEYTYYEDRFYLFPTPGSIYTLTLSYIKRLTALSVSGDSNGWTNYAEEMIRQRAEADLRINQLRNAQAVQEAAMMAMRGDQFLSAAEKIAYLRISSERDSRVSVGRVRARFL